MPPMHTFVQLLRFEQQIIENNHSAPLRLLDKSDQEEDFISSAEVSDCTSEEEEEEEEDSLPSLPRQHPQRQSRNRRMASKPSLQIPSKTPKKTVRFFWVCFLVTCPSCIVKNGNSKISQKQLDS